MTTSSNDGPSGRSSRAALWVGAGIFLTRIGGFVRGALESGLLGTGRVADVWALAIKIPNVIQNLLGEGTLSASMVPVYAEMLEEGREEEAGRFAGAALGLVSVVAWGLALLGVLAAPWIATLNDFGPAQQELLATVLRILFPMVAFISMSAWALGILNSHRRFFVSYVAPLLWNLSLITALVVFGVLLGWSDAERQPQLLVAVAWGALVGGALQLLIQLPWIGPALRHFRLSVSTRVVGMREAIRNFGPVVAARGVVTLSGILEAVLASFLAFGGVSALYYANRFYLLPISLFGLSVAAAELPELSRERKAGAEVLRGRVRDGLWRVWFFVVPTAIAYIAIGDLLLGTVYERGGFGRDSTTLVYFVLAAFSLGLPASASSRLLSSAYYGLRDTRTPALMSVIRMILSLGVGVALMFPLDGFGVGDKRLGAVGLALGASLAAWVEYFILRVRLGRVLPDHGPGAGRGARLTVAALLAGVAAYGAKLRLGSAYPVRGGPLADLLPASPIDLTLLASLVGTGVVFGVVFVAAARVLGVGELLRLRAR